MSAEKASPPPTAPQCERLDMWDAMTARVVFAVCAPAFRGNLGVLAARLLGVDMTQEEELQDFLEAVKEAGSSTNLVASYLSNLRVLQGDTRRRAPASSATPDGQAFEADACGKVAAAARVLLQAVADARTVVRPRKQRHKKPRSRKAAATGAAERQASGRAAAAGQDDDDEDDDDEDDDEEEEEEAEDGEGEAPGSAAGAAVASCNGCSSDEDEGHGGRSSDAAGDGEREPPSATGCISDAPAPAAAAAAGAAAVAAGDRRSTSTDGSESLASHDLSPFGTDTGGAAAEQLARAFSSAGAACDEAAGSRDATLESSRFTTSLAAGSSASSWADGMSAHEEQLLLLYALQGPVGAEETLRRMACVPPAAGPPAAAAPAGSAPPCGAGSTHGSPPARPPVSTQQAQQQRQGDPSGMHAAAVPPQRPQPQLQAKVQMPPPPGHEVPAPPPQPGHAQQQQLPHAASLAAGAQPEMLRSHSSMRQQQEQPHHAAAQCMPQTHQQQHTYMAGQQHQGETHMPASGFQRSSRTFPRQLSGHLMNSAAPQGQQQQQARLVQPLRQPAPPPAQQLRAVSVVHIAGVGQVAGHTSHSAPVPREMSPPRASELQQQLPAAAGVGTQPPACYALSASYPAGHEVHSHEAAANSAAVGGSSPTWMSLLQPAPQQQQLQQRDKRVVHFERVPADPPTSILRTYRLATGVAAHEAPPPPPPPPPPMQQQQQYVPWTGRAPSAPPPMACHVRSLGGGQGVVLVDPPPPPVLSTSGGASGRGQGRSGGAPAAPPPAVALQALQLQQVQQQLQAQQQQLQAQQQQQLQAQQHLQVQQQQQYVTYVPVTQLTAGQLQQLPPAFDFAQAPADLVAVPDIQHQQQQQQHQRQQQHQQTILLQQMETDSLLLLLQQSGLSHAVLAAALQQPNTDSSSFSLSGAHSLMPDSADANPDWQQQQQQEAVAAEGLPSTWFLRGSTPGGYR